MLHLQVKFLDLKTLIEMPIITLIVLPLIHYLIIKPDPLQFSPSKKKAIRFFQNEFPSKYILKRCRRCIEDENSCPNYVKEETYAHIRYWFHNIFHGDIEKEDPNRVRDTFHKGYACKLLYYSSWILGIFFLVSLILILIHYVYLHFLNQLKIEITSLQVLFPIICILIVIIIWILNKPKEPPYGVWAAWRQINRIHISWLKSHEDLLIKIICKDGQGTKRFIEK